MNFDIKAERAGGDVWVIALSGEVDLYTAPEFKQQLVDVIGQGAQTVIVDLTDTTSFGKERITIPAELADQKWVRVEIWDVATNGAFTQPVWID